MSHDELDSYFRELPAWMKNDIRREIQLARASRTRAGEDALKALGIEPGGGNLLAALGLVAYTEALGRIRLFNQGLPYDGSRDAFLAFFDRMASPRYADWRAEWEARRGVTVYEVLRCGLAHEYHPKVPSAFHIGDGADLGLEEARDGVLIFNVEPYFRHFSTEADALYDELRALPDPRIPPPKWTPNRTGADRGARDRSFDSHSISTRRSS